MSATRRGRELVDELLRAGFVISGRGKHIKLTAPNGKPLFVSSTPSKRGRTRQNDIAQARRILGNPDAFRGARRTGGR